ncbi:unnamed protein product [Cuscuta campestris]|uniref:Secreted protein n=1 Tax=Cuscuta campestris TaxID=132261 RepID=A0A484LR47_9ASTE|nr:unnamed protein product [Cuscuta campestris]
MFSTGILLQLRCIMVSTQTIFSAQKYQHKMVRKPTEMLLKNYAGLVLLRHPPVESNLLLRDQLRVNS